MEEERIIYTKKKRGWFLVTLKLVFLAVLLVALYGVAYQPVLLPVLKNIEELAVGTDTVQEADNATQAQLPAPSGEKAVSFDWKYRGKKYSLGTKLYDSYYQFYSALPTGVAEGPSEREQRTLGNQMFVTLFDGDDTVPALARSLQALGAENKLDENQMVELVTAFVQTIPYDQEKLDRRTSGLDGATEKILYPYEVLYQETGVCQDKSHLAYALLRELGYGVAFFLFPDPRDNHMAVGVKCPLQYSNYDSGYCFLETTSLGNRIGVVPDLIPQSRIATSDIAIASFASDQPETEYEPLGRVEILNTVEGKEYTGIIQTISMERELASLKKTLNTQSSRLTALNADIAGEQAELDALEKKLKSLSKDERYDEYNDLVPKYNKKLSAMKKDIKAYNADVAAYNRMADRYNTVKNTLYR
ncbi:MAG: hypothetical protein A3E38_03220 [Candidatus Moranbacteria bacterium RIFCSPHIGHO2_12_FULL_54_9]|nr:MAG: hypothetical protein A2878_02750 [Candidatus Moranbacteria bacterium RIFCSPHIGHO2_01_FULL_54_31]OGI24658.1 MAG: hypothetical protein A3E38_03220 [Candidatus Moranbacteria bacterium RIFCSPHIGHO2_12_FULL_54_9]